MNKRELKRVEEIRRVMLKTHLETEPWQIVKRKNQHNSHILNCYTVSELEKLICKLCQVDPERIMKVSKKRGLWKKQASQSLYSKRKRSKQ